MRRYQAPRRQWDHPEPEEVQFPGRVSRLLWLHHRGQRLALSKFPQPEGLTDLRSFLGLVHQMGSFSPEVAGAAEPLQQLLRPRNEWLWTEEHTRAFNEVKTALVMPPVLGFFDPKRRTVLEIDAALLKGLDFCLRQQDEAGTWRLIQCGSRLTTDMETTDEGR